MTRVSSLGPNSRSPRLLRRLAVASIAANVAVVVTGGAVRLTSSGLGCPTWPKCTDTSYTTTAEMGVHGVIEFGNRLLGVGVGLIALAGLVAALLYRPRRRRLVLISGAVLLGIPGQGVIGGIVVLTDLNPWVVGLHFLLSMALIAGAYAFWREAGAADDTAGRHAGGRRPARPARPLRTLAWLITAASAAVIVLGVVVTGSGPHAGDLAAKRNGLDPQAVSQVHADLVFLLLGLSVATWFALRAAGAPHPAVRAAALLLAVELAQGLIGFVQYFTQLPAALVAAHLLGACLVWLATVNLLWHVRRAPAGPSNYAGTPGATSAPAPPRLADQGLSAVR